MLIGNRVASLTPRLTRGLATPTNNHHKILIVGVRYSYLIVVQCDI